MSKQIERGFSELVGKTVESVDQSFLNVVNIVFEDGTVYTIDTVRSEYGIYSPIADKVK